MHLAQLQHQPGSLPLPAGVKIASTAAASAVSIGRTAAANAVALNASGLGRAAASAVHLGRSAAADALSLGQGVALGLNAPPAPIQLPTDKGQALVVSVAREVLYSATSLQDSAIAQARVCLQLVRGSSRHVACACFL